VRYHDLVVQNQAGHVTAEFNWLSPERIPANVGCVSCADKNTCVKVRGLCFRKRACP